MNTLDRVREIIAKGGYLRNSIAGEHITPASCLLDDLGLDSLSRVALVMDVEEAFDVAASDEDIEQMVFVSDLVAFAEGKPRGGSVS